MQKSRTTDKQELQDFETRTTGKLSSPSPVLVLIGLRFGEHIQSYTARRDREFARQKSESRCVTEANGYEV